GSTLDQRNGVKGYNPKWSSAVTQKGDDWFLEAAIPFQALGLSSPVDRIAFNIGRNGPNMTARSWGKEYGNCASSFLIFEGVANKAVEEEAKSFSDSPFLAIQGTSLGCAFDRSFARKGERWIEINLSLKPSVSLEKTKLMATIYRIGESKPLDSAIVVPKRDSCTLFIDPRAKQLSKARLEIKFIENEIQTGSAEILLRAESASRITAGTKIPIIIDFPDDDAKTANQPVTFGVPFKRGELWNVKRLVLTDANNNFVPCQTEITGLWDMDGAIQWVRFDALVAPGKKYFVSVGDPVISVAPHKRVRAEKNGDAMILDTGVAKYTIGKGASPIREIWRGDKLIATSKGTKGLYVIDQKGRVATADSAEMTIKVESAGPVAASIRCEGFYKTSDGVPLARHITRIECFAGKPFAKITHTLILTSDTNKVWFKDIGWEFDVAAGADPKALFNIDYKNSGKIESVPM
ncbi:MAG: hypothetical protein KAG97_06420, partial [Victivallales bacterium]|nr:hypothetical protein [Victivallales bacterium]